MKDRFDVPKIGSPLSAGGYALKVFHYRYRLSLVAPHTERRFRPDLAQKVGRHEFNRLAGNLEAGTIGLRRKDGKRLQGSFQSPKRDASPAAAEPYCSRFEGLHDLDGRAGGVEQ